MNISVTIDRIEEDFAVLEFDVETTIPFPVKYLPGDIKEGDKLSMNIEK